MTLALPSPAHHQGCDDSSLLIVEAQRKRHSELITQLKSQLEELESYAYESGDAIVPSKLILERQKLVMGQLLILITNSVAKIVQQLYICSMKHYLA